jgi:hypothetical protein
MPNGLRFLAFWLLAIGCSLTRAAIAVGGGEVPRQYYVANGGKMFDFALDAVIGSIALIAGIWFYIPVGGSLLKPGTMVAITATDVAACSFVSFMALIGIVVLQILSGPFELHGLERDFVAVLVPDFFAMVALAITVVRLT